jgi:hypothetical protein
MIRMHAEGSKELGTYQRIIDGPSGHKVVRRLVEGTGELIYKSRSNLDAFRSFVVMPKLV